MHVCLCVCVYMCFVCVCVCVRVALIAESRSELQPMLTVMDELCERWGMRISVE